jgi:peptidoglycan hydrolase-like protein with peptidoglycan-binding domain
MTEAQERPRPRSRRRWVWGSVVATATAGCAVAAVALVGLPSGTEDAASAGGSSSSSGQVATAEVVRGDLSGTTTQPGELGVLEGPSVVAGTGGTLTELPAPGAELASRSVLYRVDDTPVVAVEGALPQWRTFEAGMTDGPDVRQLEESLVAWGFLKGAADEEFDARTTAAVKAWQKELGLPRTGVVEKGRVQFVTGSFVVGETSAKVGDQVGGDSPLYATGRSDRIVTVDLPVGSPLAVVGAVVSIHLPDGRAEPGQVSAVGSPQAADGGKTVVPVTVSFDVPDAAGDLDDANVSVDFVSETATDVLSVPVVALGASVDGGFVVDVVGEDGSTTPVTVEVGLFAGDRVEVRGEIAEGDRVVVPGS